MPQLYVLEELIPIESELVDNHYEKIIAHYQNNGYNINYADNLNQLNKGESYLDSEGKLKVKQ